MVDTEDPIVVAVGDSAMWTTGTRYEDKTPNLVHEALRGEPIPPARFRARGGATIGLSPPASARLGGSGWYESGRGYYDFKEDTADWYTFHTPDDWSDVNQLKWTLARDVGSSYPTISQQLEQFPTREELPYDAGERQTDEWRLDVPERAVDQLQRNAPPRDVPPRAEDVDLLLVNGGTNDIGLEWLMDYRTKSRSDLRNAVGSYCGTDLSELLLQARERFRNAVIVVVGYFPFLSDWTDYGEAREFLRRMLGGFTGSAAAIERVIDHATTFARAHVHFMRAVVAARMRRDIENDAPGTVFVARGFGTVHSFASTATDSWTWGQYDDDTHRWREDVCQHLHPSNERVDADDFASDDRTERSDWAACISAAIGHPNRTGSRRTADAIVDRWERYVEQSTRPAVEELADRTPLSVGDEIRRFGLGFTVSHHPQDGDAYGVPDEGSSLRYALTHRTVDSIELFFDRGRELDEDRQGIGRNPYLLDEASIYLEVSPGRGGDGERFRVDWEDGDGPRQKDTPQFDKHSGTGTFVYVDPMMGRDMTGDVGAHDEGVVGGDDDPDRSYRGGDDWDDDRLRLGHVQEARLVIENPSRWALYRVRLTINGDVTYVTSVDGVTNDDRVVIDGLLDNGYTAPPPEPPRTPDPPGGGDAAAPEGDGGGSAGTPGFGVGHGVAAIAGSAVLVKWLLDDDGDD